MLEIILGLIGIMVAIFLIKKIGKFLINLLKVFFLAVFKIIYFILVGPEILCTKIFYWLTKILHLQGFIYYLLSLCSIPSIIYLCAVHGSYSRKERFIDSKEFFAKKKRIRNDTIAMACFVTYEGLLFIALTLKIRMSEDCENGLMLLGAAYFIAAFVYIFVKISRWKKENKSFYEHCIEWRKWTQKEAARIPENTVEERLLALCEKLNENDENNNKFSPEEMPYGRATAFISYFNKNLDDEEPVYFSPKMSSDDNELREYGMLVTTKGVYISAEKNKEQEENSGKQYDVEIPFEGLWLVSNDELNYTFDYGLHFGEPLKVSADNSMSSVKLNVLAEILNELSDISLSMAQGKVFSELDEAMEAYQKSSVDEAKKQFDAEIKVKEISKTAEISGVAAGLEKNADVYSKVKNNFDGKQGHGTAAEHANNLIDSLNPFNNAEHLGSDNALNGADRSLNGQLIQCKYCETGRRCINEAFEDHGKGEFRYKGMQIEVPHDEKIYKDAVKAMREKIENGQVPGESNPKNAEKYVRRGHVTYLQAYNIAGAGSIESITIDATQGIVCSLPGAGVTAIITFTTALWNKVELKKAAKMSAVAGLKVMGKGAVIYTLTMQFSRGKVVNPFYSILKQSGKSANKYTTNYVAKGANTLAKKIGKSGLAKSKLGKVVKLDKMQGRQLISGTVTAVVVYGPDVGRALQGKISGKQLIKNSTVNTAGLVGAAVGTMIPIPVVGTMIGGAVGSFVAKKVMDNFIEDDAITMYRIMREEFLDIVMLFSFNKEEFDEIVFATIANSEISKVLQAMYQSGTPKDYADALINAEVQHVLSKREKITNDKIEQGMKLLLEDSGDDAGEPQKAKVMV